MTFVATALASGGPALAMVTQPSTSAQSGVAFPVQPAVRLRDAEGNDLSQSGVSITASVAGAATLGGTATQVTNAGGVVTFSDLSITGPAGPYTLQFSADGFAPISSGTITLAAAGGIVITTNPPVSALDGEVFDPVVQPVVKVTDAGGAAAAGVQVTASIGSGGGTLQGTPTATTDAAGLAKFGDLGITGAGASAIEFTAGSQSVTSSPVTVTALPSEATTGQWGPVVPWDIVPLHMTLLPTRKILVWGKTDVPIPSACRGSGILPRGSRRPRRPSPWTPCCSAPATR